MTQPSTPNAPQSSPATFQPLSPELGLLQRCREWIDVFPWLRLVRVTRLAGSPTWLGNVALVFAVWSFVAAWALPSMWPRIGAYPEPAVMTSAVDLAAPMPLLKFLDERLPWEVSRFVNGDPGAWALLAWTLLCWTPMAMVLMRLGGCLTAGRELPEFVATWRWMVDREGGFGGGRVMRGWLVSVLPLLCALPFLLLLWLTGRVLGWVSDVVWAQVAGLVITLPTAIVVGVLLAAGKFAVPLAWAALSLEKDPDPLDSLSRGYEYVLRRLPRLITLALVAATLVAIVALAWRLVAVVATLTVTQLMPPESVSLTLACLSQLPMVVAITVGWAMVGGVYLLLRQSAGGQEVEDIELLPAPRGLSVPAMG